MNLPCPPTRDTGDDNKLTKVPRERTEPAASLKRCACVVDPTLQQAPGEQRRAAIACMHTTLESLRGWWGPRTSVGGGGGVEWSGARLGSSLLPCPQLPAVAAQVSRSKISRIPPLVWRFTGPRLLGCDWFPSQASKNRHDLLAVTRARWLELVIGLHLYELVPMWFGEKKRHGEASREPGPWETDLVLISTEPGGEAWFASAQLGSNRYAVIQSRTSCMRRAWMKHMQATKRTLKRDA
jgi:hypothetical protein